MKSQRWQAELAGLAVVVGALYGGLALFRGQAGEAGARLAAWLWEALGLASVPALAGAVGVGWRLMRRPGAAGVLARLAGAAAGVGGVAAALELSEGVRRWSRAFVPAGVAFASTPGGHAGRWMAAALQQAVGLSGTYLAVGVLLLAAAAFLFESSPARVVEWPLTLAGRALRGGARLAWRAGVGLGGAARRAAGAMGARRHRSAEAAGSLQEAAAADQAPGAEVGGARRARREETAGTARGTELALPDGPAPLRATGAELPAAGPEEGTPEARGAWAGPDGRTGGSWPAGGRSARERRDGQDGEPAVPLTGSTRGHWRLPPSSLLTRPPARRRGGDEQEVAARSRVLEQTLASFGIEARVVSHTRGPVVTRYEMALAPGVKLSRVLSLADDLALALASTGVRIEAPVPGKPVIGVEVPNASVETVYLREVLESPAFARSSAPLALALGKDVAGEPLVGDLERLIHLLIAGATGSGKSVCLASIIMSLLYRLTPDQLRLLLIDPKRVELTVYEGIPHLLAPVVTDARQAAAALRWAVREMEARYQALARAGARHLAAYNQMAAQGRVEAPLPYVVVVIDELADLMLVAAADVEDSICRLAQMARAAGIHLVIATQRPSTDVITGLIKANIPSRLAFAVSSQVDSRTILDAGGAERLLGRGDMLYHPLGEPKPVRAQGCLVTEREIEQVVGFWKSQGEPDYRVDLFEEEEKGAEAEGEVDDALYDEAVRLVVEAGQASVSMLQRRFRIGYARAARLIDLMEQRGVVGPYQGSKPREVLPPYRRRERSA